MLKKEIAVLITCHDRKEKTLVCLTALYNCIMPANHTFEVYLVDDGSTDGTAQALKDNFPQVNIIQGNGQLYWNRGMRLAWESASKTKDNDYYLWLNDDTILDVHGLIELVACGNDALKFENKPAIITGACRKSASENEFSYGGRTEAGPILPNEDLQKCKYINGNAVLVPNEIYQILGNLSPDYTHAMGDFDYGLRANKAGFYCYTTRNYIAVCEINKGIPAWCNPETPLLKRLKLLNSPNGLNIKEYNIFRKKFEGKRWLLFSIKAYLKAINPSFYKKLSNTKLN